MSHSPEHFHNIKNILASILIGACVAFISSLADGLIGFLQDDGNNIIGAITASLRHLVYNLKT